MRRPCIHARIARLCTFVTETDHPQEIESFTIGNHQWAARISLKVHTQTIKVVCLMLDYF